MGIEIQDRAFSMERVDYEDARSEIRFHGELTLPHAVAIWADTRELLLSVGQSERVDFNLSGVKRMDGGTMALLLRLKRDLIQQGRVSHIIGAEGVVADLVALYDQEDCECLQEPPGGVGLIEQIGRGSLELVKEIKLILTFLGGLILSIGAACKRPRTINWRDVPLIMERAGADGLPIIILINFLIGFIIAFQGAVQLKQFGANIFVADMVGLSITRVLGPLMTAIVVAGRSGAAFAAELGTMKVSEEVDALESMGFDPMRFLVMPRIIGLVLVVPLLTLMADVVAILGGLLVGIVGLDLTVVAYVNQTQNAIGLWDVCSGLLKSLVFAGAIAFIACQQGLATSGGAQGVGRRTTSSVVSILLALILIDAAFTIVFVIFDV